MTKVKGWDTIGVTELGALSDGRVKLQFTGTDGLVRNIFVPAGHARQLAAEIVRLMDRAEVAPTGAKH